MKQNHGSATLVVLVLVALVTLLLLANSNAILQLQQDIHRVDQQQQQRFQRGR